MGALPEVEVNYLSNNIPVYLIEAGTEEIMRIEFLFKAAGQINEYIPLLSTTTNLMLSEGSLKYNSEELNRILDYYGVFLNLSAEKDSAGAVFFFLNKHIERILELSREIIFRPLFESKELDILMKKRLRWYLVSREKVQNLATDQFFESVFGKHHPYGRKVLDSDFECITSAMLMDFHLKRYTSENMAIIISGRIHKNSMMLMDRFFGDLRPCKIYIEDTENHLRGGARKKIKIEKPGRLQSAIKIGSSTINKRHPDYPGLKIVNTILGGYFGSRLMRNIREEKGYTYGISSSVSSLDLAGFKVISTEVGRENTQNAIDEIYREIKNLQTESVEKEELSVVKNYMTGELVRMFDGPFALAESFKTVWEFGLDYSYYYKLSDKIKSITPDEIRELARTYYNIEELYEIVAG